MADEDEVSEFEVESCIIEDDFSFSVCTFDERSLHEPSKYHTNHVVSKRNTIDLNVTNDPARSPLAVLEAGGIAPRTTMEKKKKGKKEFILFGGVGFMMVALVCVLIGTIAVPRMKSKTTDGTLASGEGQIYSTSDTGTNQPTTMFASQTVEGEKFYADWDRFKCVKDCEGPAPCGGSKEQWEQPFDTLEECCEENFPDKIIVKCSLSVPATQNFSSVDLADSPTLSPIEIHEIRTNHPTQFHHVLSSEIVNDDMHTFYTSDSSPITTISANPTHSPTLPRTTSVTPTSSTISPSKSVTSELTSHEKKDTSTPSSNLTKDHINSPIHEPSLSPLAYPTSKPTPKSSSDPTREPTVRPTPQPTLNPTQLHTMQPIHQPTPISTRKPTAKPTLQLTSNPTLEPTMNLTFHPTSITTENHTKTNSMSLNSKPTHLLLQILPPTQIPTSEPTTKKEIVSKKCTLFYADWDAGKCVKDLCTGMLDSWVVLYERKKDCCLDNFSWDPNGECYKPSTFSPPTDSPSMIIPTKKPSHYSKNEIAPTYAPTMDATVHESENVVLFVDDNESSMECPDNLNRFVQLDASVTFHYAILTSSSINSPEGVLCGRLDYDGIGWVALAVSKDMKMAGSEAIIGLPGDNTVLKYNLNGMAGNLVSPMDDDKQTLKNTLIMQEDGRTIMKFAKILEEEGEIAIEEMGVNYFLHARGSDNSLGYHAERLGFELEFSSYDRGGEEAPPSLSPQPNIPTKRSTTSPSKVPTFSPSFSVTELPSSGPTLTPTSNPTYRASGEPSSAPTIFSTFEPTLYPTMSPSHLPTANPTDLTKLPTQIPVGATMESPTAYPTKSTDLPTQSPVGIPTESPTAHPAQSTDFPTLSPVGTLTESPTLYQPKWTELPTQNPAGVQSEIHSEVPTDKSLSPSVALTSSPFEEPSNLLNSEKYSCPKKYDGFVQVDSSVKFLYTVVSSQASLASFLCGRLEYDGLGWVALAVSKDTQMIGSEAIIGLPDSGEVLKYHLNGMATNMVDVMDDDSQTLADASIVQENGTTIMVFTKLLAEGGEIPILKEGVNHFLHARGSSNDFGYHSHRSSFGVNFAANQFARSLPPVHLPTDKPTNFPTARSTPKPSTGPTPSPTLPDFSYPTYFPTIFPTYFPTVEQNNSSWWS